MSYYGIHFYLLKAGLGVSLAFWLWWIILKPIILPGLAWAVKPLFENSFSQYQVTLRTEKIENWYIATKIYKTRKPHPQKKTREVWFISIGNLTTYTLGLPLLWGFLLVTPYRSLRNFFWGTTALALLILLLIWAKSSLTLLSLLADEGIKYVRIYAGYYQAVPIFSQQLLNILQSIHNIGIYLIILPLPALLIGWLNRPFIRVLIFNTLISQSLQSNTHTTPTRNND